MTHATLVDTNILLKERVTDYVPPLYHTHYGAMVKRPVFTLQTIREMIIDPRVTFGLWLIKGPMLAKASFQVLCKDAEVTEFIQKMLNAFWINGAVQALKAIEWGFSGSEVLYTRNEEDGRIEYKSLKDFDSPSVQIVTKNGCRTGILVDNFQTLSMRSQKAVYLGGMKAFHHVHWRHHHPIYGRSRLYGAHIPWNEIWSDGGFRDIRRIWFHKNAFEGGTLYHPQGMTRMPDGRVVSYRDMALEIMEKKRTGGVLTLPSDTNSGNQRKWEYSPASGNTIPAGLFEYGGSLRIEILEAMGIPYEVIESSGNEGFGSSSGRAIPETAFYSILQEELNWLLFDFVDQILNNLVRVNAALGLMPYAPFQVTAQPLDAMSVPVDEEMEEEGVEGEETDEEGNPVQGKGTPKKNRLSPTPDEDGESEDGEDGKNQKRMPVKGKPKRFGRA